jgi:hypothetical protein
MRCESKLQHRDLKVQSIDSDPIDTMATADVQSPLEWNVNDSEAVISNDPAKIYKEYDYMRQKCPVAHVDRHNGYWMLTR